MKSARQKPLRTPTPAAPTPPDAAPRKRSTPTRRRKTATPESPAALPPESPARFAALDFETADYGRDSACALAIVFVENGIIVDTWTRLIRPPRRDFVFTYLHGISWFDVHDKPTFAETWPEIADRLSGVDFLAAHNASFDRSVLRTCCDQAGHKPPHNPFLCTVKVARSVWNLFPTKLSDVARHLRLTLKHHDAASDALACANILIRAQAEGHAFASLLKKHKLK
jgi:DNA polymerase-3 subunit epsilon